MQVSVCSSRDLRYGSKCVFVQSSVGKMAGVQAGMILARKAFSNDAFYHLRAVYKLKLPKGTCLLRSSVDSFSRRLEARCCIVSVAQVPKPYDQYRHKRYERYDSAHYLQDQGLFGPFQAATAVEYHLCDD